MSCQSEKKLMQQAICNPDVHGNLVYKFKNIIGNPNFSNLFKRIVNRFKRAGYSLDIMRQTACLVFKIKNLLTYLLSYLHQNNLLQNE